VFSPLHSGVKSDEFLISALVRNAVIAVAASGNSGATLLIGPSSLIARLMMSRAGRPENALVKVVCGLQFFEAYRDVEYLSLPLYIASNLSRLEPQ